MRESSTAEQLARDLGFAVFESVPLPLHDWRDDPSKWPSPRQEGWIPYRNAVIYSLAAHYAAINGCDLIASGIRIWDTSAFSDATPDYLLALEKLLKNSGVPDSTVEMEFFVPLIDAHTPIFDFLKVDPRALDTLLKTWSCWRDGPVPCNACAPCVTRKAFLDEFEKG